MVAPNSNAGDAGGLGRVLLVRSSYLVILMISLSGVAIPAAPPIPIVKGEWPQDTLPAIFAEGQDPTAEFNDFGWRLFLAAAWPGDAIMV